MNIKRVLIEMGVFFGILLLFLGTAGAQCIDSDGNLTLEEQSFIAGGVSYSSGDFKTGFIDWCEQGKIVLEQICKNGKPETVGAVCKFGCTGGNCNREAGELGGENVLLPSAGELPKNFSFDGFDCEGTLRRKIGSWVKEIKAEAQAKFCDNGKLIGNLDYQIRISNLRRGLPGASCTAFAVIEKQGEFRCETYEGFFGWLKKLFVLD